MWFVFPQLRGLGRSPTAQFYGITSLDEARAYLDHPVLEPRLDEATRAVLSTSGLSVQEIFGAPDDLKFHSSMTLLALATSVVGNPYREALDRWFGGKMDDMSPKLLEDASPNESETTITVLSSKPSRSTACGPLLSQLHCRYRVSGRTCSPREGCSLSGLPCPKRRSTSRVATGRECNGTV